MPIPSNSASTAALRLKEVPAPKPLRGFLISVSKFPLADGELILLKTFLNRMVAVLEVQMQLGAEVFLQFAQIHLGDAKVRLARHGSEWLPQVGLGVWPDRPPPTIWTREEFMNLGMHDKPRRLMFQVFRISAPSEIRQQARDTMLGLGTVVEIMAPDPIAFLPRATQTLKQCITDPSFTCFPFYLPLLDCRSLEAASSHDLLSWLSGATAYIRESPEDSGVLLISAHELSATFEQLGARYLISDGIWEFA